MLPEAVLVMAAALPTQDFSDQDVRESSVEIARVVTEAKRPLFQSREFDAAVLLTTDYAEARFVHEAVGDGGGALCEFQLHDAPRSVLTDLGQCVDIGYERLRLSVRMCREFPLAQYIGGCDRRSAQWQSEYRMNIARRILTEAQKRREFRSPEHLIRDMVEDAFYAPVERVPRRSRTIRGRATHHIRVRRQSSTELARVAHQRQARASPDVELMSARKLLDAIRREWPYEPGWYDTNIDGFMCSGDACLARDAPALPKNSSVYMGGGIGDVLCAHCYYERRRRLSRAS